MTRLMRRPAGDAGVTLIELVLVVAILGIVMTALGGAMYVGIRTSTDDQRTLDQSNAQQLLAQVLSPDVAAACAVQPPPSQECPRPVNPSIASGPACGSTARFALDTYASVASTTPDSTIGYVLAGGTLTRVACAYGATAPTSSRIIAGNVSAVNASYPSTGRCTGQFEVDVTVAGTTTGNGTPDFSFTVCAHARAS